MIQEAGYHVMATMGSWAATPGDTYWDDCGNHQGDPTLHDGAYFGTNIHPYETVFFKSNRGLAPELLKLMKVLHSKPNNAKRSYKLCK